MDTARLREYARLRRAQKDREAEAAAIKAEADVMEQELLEAFAEDSIQSMNIDNTTIYLSRTLWAKVEDGVATEEVIETLRDAGLGHFVKEGYNSTTLSAWMRDLEREGQPLPDELAGVLGTYEKFQLKTRRS